jgi:hypothetical protein
MQSLLKLTAKLTTQQAFAHTVRIVACICFGNHLSRGSGKQGPWELHGEVFSFFFARTLPLANVNIRGFRRKSSASVAFMLISTKDYEHGNLPLQNRQEKYYDTTLRIYFSFQFES